MAHAQPGWKYLTLTSPEDASGVYVITLNKPPENRLNVEMGQEIISALRYTEKHLVTPGQAGAVIITSFSEKFWCTGVDFEEGALDPSAGAEGFYPVLATLLDFALPTVALITGHTYGGACPLSLACDYRIMNSKRGFYCMPPVDLGLHFDGIGLLPRLKLYPRVARKMLLYAHRWTAEEAVTDGIIDEAVPPDKMRTRAIEVAKEHAPRAKAGVFALLRNELYGQASRQLQTLSHRHHRLAGGQPRTKI